MSAITTTGFPESPLEEIDPQREEYSVTDVIHVLLCILSVALQIAILSSDIFLICIICKCRRLRTRINTYILNCASINLVMSIAEPLYIIVLAINMPFRTMMSVHFTCLKINDTLKIIYVAFAFGLALDWFVSLWKPNTIRKYNQYYKWVFLGVYVICILQGVISRLCSDYNDYEEYIVLYSLYIIVVVTVVVMHVIGRRMKPNEYSTKTAYPLTTSYIILLSFTPLLLIFFIYMLPAPGFAHYTVVSIATVCSFILRGHPILVVYMLGRQNKHFKMAYQQCFKKSLRRYGGDNLDETSDDETSNRIEEVKVNCANGNVQISATDRIITQ